MESLKIGTRTSDLAVYQAERVKALLIEFDSGLEVEIKKIKTKGDKILDKPLSEIGGKGVFLKEIEKYLIEGEIDLAVHSLKDVPISLPEGLELGAFMDEEDPRDCLVSLEYEDIEDLPSGGKVGTGSLRRKCQLLRERSDLKVVPVRGNVDTRVKKLRTEDFDALILASSGLKRLGLEDKIATYLSPDRFLPAPGQGVLAVEIRDRDSQLRSFLKEVEDERLSGKMLAERMMLKTLGGDCHVPVGAHTEFVQGELSLTAMVGSPEGQEYIEVKSKSSLDDAEQLGEEIASSLWDAGAEKFLGMEE